MVENSQRLLLFPPLPNWNSNLLCRYEPNPDEWEPALWIELQLSVPNNGSPTWISSIRCLPCFRFLSQLIDSVSQERWQNLTFLVWVSSVKIYALYFQSDIHAVGRRSLPSLESFVGTVYFRLPLFAHFQMECYAISLIHSWKERCSAGGLFAHIKALPIKQERLPGSVSCCPDKNSPLHVVNLAGRAGLCHKRNSLGWMTRSAGSMACTRLQGEGEKQALQQLSSLGFKSLAHSRVSFSEL